MSDSAPQPRIRSDARENRQRLLDAAKTLFAQQGVEATSMQEIARLAGVGQGTLYRNFEDKGAICLALIEDDLVAFRTRLEAVIAGDWAVPSPLLRLELLISEKVRMFEQHLPLLATIDRSAQQGGRRSGDFYQWQFDHCYRLLHEAIEQGEIEPLDVEFTVQALLALASPRLFHREFVPRGYDSERIIAGIKHLFVTSLRKKASD